MPRWVFRLQARYEWAGIQVTSGAGFAAANCTLLAVAIFYAYEDLTLVIPMLIGSGIATLIGMHLVYRLFDSELFPATGTWPPGIATAQALIAGDEGGRKGRHLLMGVFLGALGSSKLFTFPALGISGLPMAGVGIAFIANVYAMLALAIGLLVRGYFHHIAPWAGPILASIGFENVTDLGKTYIPHGVMIGAGAISLVQAMVIIFRHKKPAAMTENANEEKFTVSPESVKKTLSAHIVLFALGAVVLAVISGIWSEMPMQKLAVWVLWCTFSAIVAPILVGLSAMHSGWFPGFAVTIIFLSLGVFMGFPPHALILLTGYVASTGPCFADMGYDLKTGWIVRGRGTDVAYELDGRRQQVISELDGAPHEHAFQARHGSSCQQSVCRNRESRFEPGDSQAACSCQCFRRSTAVFGRCQKSPRDPLCYRTAYQKPHLWCGAYHCTSYQASA